GRRAPARKHVGAGAAVAARGALDDDVVGACGPQQRREVFAHRVFVAGAPLGAGLLGRKRDELGEKISDDHDGTWALPDEGRDAGESVRASGSSDRHASWRSISPSARASSVLPGSMRCQVDAPDGWGRAMTSNAAPASSLRRTVPTTSASCAAALPG